MTRWMTLIALLFAGSIAACNTIEGAGQDIQQGGEAISNTADRANPGTP